MLFEISYHCIPTPCLSGTSLFFFSLMHFLLSFEYILSSFPSMWSTILEGATGGHFQEFIKANLLLFPSHYGPLCCWIGQQLPLPLFIWSHQISLPCFPLNTCLLAILDFSSQMCHTPCRILLLSSALVHQGTQVCDCWFVFVHMEFGGVILSPGFVLNLPLGFGCLFSSVYFLWDSEI